MASLNFYKVTSLPGTLVADSLYFVSNGTIAESYLTDSTGTAKSIGNTSMVNSVVTAQVTAAVASYNAMEIVATIAARNTLAASLARNVLVLVTDATGDTTVSSGAALYAYNNTSKAWTKVSEYESLDVVLTWASIQNKPTSTVAQIDSAVSQAHSHSNKTYLDKIGETGGVLTYNGTAISATTQWTTLNW
jgi:hypothetical protein